MNLPEQSSKKLFLIAAVLVLFASLSLLSAPHTTRVASASSSTGVIIPLYAYPGAMWQGLINAKRAYPSVPIIAVINPSNGPGTWQDPNILAGVHELQSVGITVVGYISTGYASVSVGTVESEIVAYRNLYGLSGVFFDQMSNVPGEEWYYSTLTSYAHGHGAWLAVGNPGTGVPSSFFNTVDILLIYENSGLPSVSLIAQRTMGYSRSHFTMSPYAVSWFPESYVEEASQYLGYMYITNGQYPDQYSSLPSYFSTFLSYLSGSGGGTGVSLTVNTLTGSGSQINGLYTVIRSSSGSILDTGFSPLTFSATSGDTYEVSVSNYGSYTFSHWGNGVTSNTIEVTPTSSETLDAYYGSGSGGGSVPVTIDSVTVGGSGVNGLYTIIRTSSGSVIDTGFTPLTFDASSGSTYTVQVDNYGKYTFSHWSTGSSSAEISVTPTGPTTLTAYYNDGSGGSSGTITLESANSNGVFSGMYMTIRSSGGTTLKTGFSTLQFSASSGSSYLVTASNYGSLVFSHWSTGSTSRTISVSGNTQTLIAYYT